MVRDIDITQEEREMLFDSFSLCETYLREEAEQAAQCFSDLVRYCPNDRSAPIRAAFDGMFSALGIRCATDLALATGVDLSACEQFYSNPLECEVPIKGQLTKALAALAGVTYITECSSVLGGKSIADYFYIAGEVDTKNPNNFTRRAMECELKCYLVGAVSSLSDSDLETLCTMQPDIYLHDSAEYQRNHSNCLKSTRLETVNS